MLLCVRTGHQHGRAPCLRCARTAQGLEPELDGAALVDRFARQLVKPREQSNAPDCNSISAPIRSRAPTISVIAPAEGDFRPWTRERPGSGREDETPLLRISGAGRIARKGRLARSALAIMLTGCALWPGNDEPRKQRFRIAAPGSSYQGERPQAGPGTDGRRASFIVKGEGVERLEELTRLWYTDRDTAKSALQELGGRPRRFEGLELTSALIPGKSMLQREFASDEVMTRRGQCMLERIRAQERWPMPTRNSRPIPA